MDPSADMMPPGGAPPPGGPPPSGAEGMPEIPPPPTPTEPIQDADAQAMVTALGDAWKFLTDGQGPVVMLPQDKEGRGVGGSQKPLPPDVWAPLFEMSLITGEFAKADPELQPLAFDANAIVTREGVKSVTKALGLIANSDKAKKMLMDALAASGGEPMPKGGVPEDKETPASEAAEPAAEQKQEADAGTEKPMGGEMPPDDKKKPPFPTKK